MHWLPEIRDCQLKIHLFYKITLSRVYDGPLGGGTNKVHTKIARLKLMVHVADTSRHKKLPVTHGYNFVWQLTT